MNTKPWSTLRSGDSSQAVSGVQYLLRAHGHLVAPDGSYGPATTAASGASKSNRLAW